ncbi:MAG TPA: DMT family transporter [Beijerinckiaceae bacterium]|nr:DMT family transporter [Beijerinckiaceae bacterium]
MTGEALSLLAAFFFAVNGVMVAKGVAEGDGRGDHGALLSIIMTVAMAAAVWVVTADTGSWRVPNVALAAGVWWFAVSGILTIFLGRTLLYQSIASIGAIRASMLLRLHPFFSVLLAALILGETVGAVAAGGMLLIMLSFALLLRRAFGQRPPGTAAEASPSPLDYVYGPASAFSYAFGAIVRKHALGLVPDASFGTLVSALTGIVSFAVAALFVERYRYAFKGVFKNASRWQVAAGLFASAGQLSNFAAIQHIEVSRAVMITSAEIFLSMFLAVYVLKTEKRPDAVTLVAGALAMAGAVLVAAG